MPKISPDAHSSDSSCASTWLMKLCPASISLESFCSVTQVQPLIAMRQKSEMTRTVDADPDEICLWATGRFRNHLGHDIEGLEACNRVGLVVSDIKQLIKLGSPQAIFTCVS